MAQSFKSLTLVEEIRRRSNIERVRELLDPETMDAALGDGDKVVFTMCIFFIVILEISILHVSTFVSSLQPFSIQLFLILKA
jgi:hypothetical protein